MTQIKTLPSQLRRPGELGVHSLDQVALTVPDLAQAQLFYESFGLDVRDDKSGFGLFCAGGAHRWCAVAAGARKRLGHLSFGCFAEDFAALRGRLQTLQIKQIDAPPETLRDGFWFTDLDGTMIEIAVCVKSSPDKKSLVANTSSPAGVAGVATRVKSQRVRPRRLAHVLVFCTDVSRTIQFYTAVLGLRLSDRSGDGIAFMHGIHGSDHHLIAFAKSNAPGLHHLSWDVNAIEQIGLGAMHMAENGFRDGWGLGRHVLGSNYFHYVRDPWGSYSEYSSDIDYIPVNVDWPAGDHPSQDAFYLWGPVPPQDFAFNYESGS